jgi:hypothetical protein
MDCPNYKQITKSVAECKPLQELGLEKIPGPSRSGHPCEACKAQWRDANTPPTKDEITIPMAKLLSYGKRMPLPTVYEQVKTIGTAGIKWAAAGFPGTTEDEFNERTSICKKNECGQYDAVAGRCHACGCFVKEKATMATETCPAKLWPEIKREVPLGTPPPMLSQGCSSCTGRF